MRRGLASLSSLPTQKLQRVSFTGADSFSLLDSGGAASSQGGANASDYFSKMKEQVGTMAGGTMTREEAIKILNLAEE